MSHLWDRGASLDERIARFTIGRDRELDLHLVAYDALASVAHAIMLERIGILDESELAGLRRELSEIAADAREGRFSISGGEEDGHSAIENRLTERLGDAGRRIHTGRSRNDQIIAAIRLWGRERLLEQIEQVLKVAGRLLELAAEHRETSLPGYTHTRQAMPSTLGFLFAAHADNLLDDLPWLETAFAHLNRSPLGSASGYGVALPLDRELVAELLGFSGVQTNTLAVQNDRGKSEALTLGAALTPALDLGRLADDLIFLSSEELGCIRLDDRITTGSSIMPQKRNPDVLELIRASAAKLRSRHAEIAAVYSHLPSGYHRDLQLTKEPFLEGMRGVSDVLIAILPVLDTLEVDRDRCRQIMQRSIGATDAVYARVAAGEPFRSAYKEVAGNPEAAVEGDPAEGWRQRTHTGAPGALELEPYRQAIQNSAERLEVLRRPIAEAWSLLASQ